MAFQHDSRLLVAVMLPLSLAFAVYLYPGSEVVAERLMHSDSNSGNATASPNVPSALPTVMPASEEVKENIRALARRSWITNLFLFLTGTAACVSWLVWGRKR